MRPFPTFPPWARVANVCTLQVSVEELALQYYASEAGGCWLGMHTEGGVWSTLFGLLMWEVLLAPVPDVFRTPFQTAPLDLGTEAFYPARRDVIEARLQVDSDTVHATLDRASIQLLGGGPEGRCIE
eukprot:361082-Chlamydomonas_euryale.AAC.24